VVAELLPVVDTRRFYLAGLSMGGFGAVRLGMKYAEGVAGVSAYSAVTRLEDLEAFVASRAVNTYNPARRTWT
jgi:putative tributyrin esterase